MSLAVDRQIEQLLEQARLKASSEVERLLAGKLAELQSASTTVSLDEARGPDALQAAQETLLHLQQLLETLQTQVAVQVDKATASFKQTATALLLAKQENARQQAALQQTFTQRHKGRMQGEVIKVEEAMLQGLQEAGRQATASYGKRCDKAERELAVTRKKVLIARF